VVINLRVGVEECLDGPLELFREWMRRKLSGKSCAERFGQIAANDSVLVFARICLDVSGVMQVWTYDRDILETSESATHVLLLLLLSTL